MKLLLHDAPCDTARYTQISRNYDAKVDPMIVEGEDVISITTPWCRELTCNILRKLYLDYDFSKVDILHIVNNPEEEAPWGIRGPMGVMGRLVTSLVKRVFDDLHPLVDYKTIKFYIRKMKFDKVDQPPDMMIKYNTQELERYIIGSSQPSQMISHGTIYGVPKEWCEFPPIISTLMTLPRIYNEIIQRPRLYFGSREPSYSAIKAPRTLFRRFWMIQAQYAEPFAGAYGCGRHYWWAFFYLMLKATDVNFDLDLVDLMREVTKNHFINGPRSFIQCFLGEDFSREKTKEEVKFILDTLIESTTPSRPIRSIRR